MRYFVVSLVLIVLSYLGFLSGISSIFSKLFHYPTHALRAVAIDIKDVISFYAELSEIDKKNESLEQENVQLKARVSELMHLQEENETLRAQLHIGTSITKDKNLIIANVRGNPLDLTGSSYYINRGEADGIKAGNNVIIGNNIVGKVQSTARSSSLVLLITSPDISLSAVDTSNPARTEGVVVGRFGTSVALTKILPNEDIKIGDEIMTSGKDGIFVPDLVVGKVLNVVGEISQPLRTAELKPLIDLRKLERVFVIL